MKKSRKLILTILLLLLVVTAVSFVMFTQLKSSPIHQTASSTAVHETSKPKSHSTNSPSTEKTTHDSKQETEPAEENPYEGTFDLPIENATGYAPIDLPVRSQADPEAKTQKTLTPGTAFKILQEKDDWWEVEYEEGKGWLEHRYAFINLPDVLPSAVYNNTNTYSSRYRSSGIEIPEVTKKALYDGKINNERLGKEEFIIPVLYTTAKKIYEAQTQALENNETLLIYETFRPYDVQEKVYRQLKKLADENEKVKEGADTAPWEMFWFINDEVSNHQMGFAIDVSLAQVDAKKTAFYGNYSVDIVQDYTEYQMPTPIHELSSASAVYTSPVTAVDSDAWKKAQLRPEMNKPALDLQAYFVQAGMTPLASEWWHFNDLEARKEIEDHKSNGEFKMIEVKSSAP